MKKVYEDENHTTEFDFSAALSVFEPHKLAAHHSEYISDVDFVVESEEVLFFVEYKNGNIVGAANPEAFADKLKRGSLANVLIKKFYGTLLMVLVTDKNPSNKPIKYMCVIEAGNGIDEVMMKKLRNKVYAGLPFDYKNIEEIKVPVIDQFEVVSLSEWNTKYTKYPVRVKSAEER